MKELTHLEYFKSLLESEENELVEQAIGQGKRALGYTCYYMPEVLLNLDNCFSVRLRAPNTRELDMSTYYMSSFLCGYSKALVERAYEGGFNFLSGFFITETCSEINRAAENIQLLNLVENENFVLTISDAPMKAAYYAVDHFRRQMEKNVLQPLAENYGVDISDQAIREAVNRHNEFCEIMTRIGELRKADAPKITGTEYHILNLVSFTCPKALLLEQFRETLAELESREPLKPGEFEARVVLVGSELDDFEFTQMIEDMGALVVADRYCFGSLPGRQVIHLTDNEDALTQVCRYYLESSQCPRFYEPKRVENRRQVIRDLVKEYKADGIIYEQLKFCEYWGYEKSLSSHIMQTEFDIPTVALDRQYELSGVGQLQTRVQAFVERVNVAKIMKGE